MLPPGTVLDRYEIGARIGEGAMGVVFAARDVRLDRPVAIKILRFDAFADATRKHRFVQEARAASALNHPNIVTVHDFGSTTEAEFLVMEYVSGVTMAEAIKAGPIALVRALDYVRAIANALATAHAAGIVHRDLKPSNIMLTDDGRIKVLDFGVAKLLSGTEVAGATTVVGTGLGALIGTPAYMSPEQAEGRPVDSRSDIFSLGIILYELVTGIRPFRGESRVEILSKIVSAEPQPPSAVAAGVPVELDRVILHSLRKDPARRYQTMRDLEIALEDAGLAQRATPGATRVRLHRRAGPTRVVVAAAIVAAIAMAWFATVWPGSDVSSSPPGVDRIESLAILPLEDESSDPEQAYFGDGMTEALITRVAQIRSLSVVPPSSVMKYRNSSRPPADVARELGVDAILQGTVLRSGDRIRVSLHLIDPHANRALWSNAYERELADFFALQEELASAVAETLQATLTPGHAVRPRRVHPGAFDSYLRGLAHLERVNREDTEAAIGRLEEATALDPTFAEAFGSLAAAYVQYYGSFAPEATSQLELRARAAIAKAYSLNPDSADAHAAEGNLLWKASHGWPHEEAARAYREAIRIRPTFDRAKRALAVVYNHVGLSEAALNELIRTDDSPASLFQRGLAHQIEGDHARAFAAWSAIPAAVRNTTHISHLAWVLSDLRRTDEAWRLLDDATASGAADVNGMLAAVRGLLYAVAGDRASAEQWVDAATARADATSESHHGTFLAAATYARLGNAEAALRWLRYTAANGFPCYPLFARDRNLQSLQAYQPYNEFLHELKIRWEDRQRRMTS